MAGNELKDENGHKFHGNKLSGPSIAVIILFVIAVVGIILSNSHAFKAFLGESPAASAESLVAESAFSESDGPDLVLNSHTFADFEEPVLGEAVQEQKLDVCEIPVSVLVVNTQDGFFKLPIMEKKQAVKFSGTAYYMVDLAGMDAGNIQVDADEKTVTLTIPDVDLDHVDVDSEKTETLEENNGALAFGPLKMTTDESSQVETEAKQKMIEELNETNMLEQAQKMAKLSAKEIFEPVIKGVASDYSVEIRLSSEAE